MKYFAILTLIFFSGIAASAQLPLCVGEKPVRFPLAGQFGSKGPFTTTRVVVQNTEPNAPLPVSVFYPSNATVQQPVPVIFFSHAYGATSYILYDSLIDQLVSNGFAVVYPPYQTTNSTNPTRYEQLWQGFVAATAEYGAIFDLTRVGFAGHSFGGGATPEMARRGVARGWGTNGLFIFSMAPWYNWGTNMNQIPSTAKLVVQVYWDDNVNDHLIAQNDVWNRMPQIVERNWQVIRASNGSCALDAGHSVPTLGGVPGSEGTQNSYDAWGIWRRLHALADYSLRGGGQAAKNVAFGVDSDMGKWRGIFGSRRIPPLESYDTPLANPLIDPAFKWSQRCLFAQGAPCP